MIGVISVIVMFVATRYIYRYYISSVQQQKRNVNEKPDF